jgi:hypothetical protein
MAVAKSDKTKLRKVTKQNDHLARVSVDLSVLSGKKSKYGG